MQQLEQDNKFVLNLYKIRGNVLKMLSRRGYTDYVKKYHADVTIDEFKKLYKKNNTTLYLYKDDIQCIVYFVDPTSNVGKIKQQFMKLVSSLEQTYDKNAKKINLIMIAEDRDINIFMHSINKYVKGYQESYNQNTKNIQSLVCELFYYSEMSFDLMSHYLQPKFELVQKNNEKEILSTFNCTKDHLPIMSKNDDPVARYYGANVGDIFKIYRRSPTAGIAIYYRVVVP